jgi:hypothetical protein
MIVRVFNTNHTSLLFVLPLLAVILAIPSFIYYTPGVVGEHMPLYSLIQIIPYQEFIFPVLTLTLIILQAILLNNLINTFELGKGTYLPALLFITLSISGPTSLSLMPATLANLFVIFSLFSLFSLSKEDANINDVFDVGFFVAIASLFYKPILVLVPVLFIGIAMFRQEVIRSWLIAFSGIIVPYSFLFTWLYWNDEVLIFIDAHFTFLLNPQPNPMFSMVEYVIYGLVALFSIAGLFLLFSPPLACSVRARRVKMLAAWLTIFMCFGWLFSYDAFLFFAEIMIVPVCIALVSFFEFFKKPFYQELYYTLLLGGILAKYLYHSGFITN